MTSLLTSISGQFGKMLVLGTLFPVLMVSILTEVIVSPILSVGPALQEQLKKIAVGDEKWTAVSLVFLVLVITGILYNLNIPIIRLYEGYPWKESYLGRSLCSRKARVFRQVVPLRLAIRYLRREIGLLDPRNKLPAELLVEQNGLARYINSELPDKEELILPTRLGNVIRSFERYSAVTYGIDAIVLWPRLVAKIDVPFAATIDDAKASFDFMLNSSFLCAVVAVIVLFIGLFTSLPLAMNSPIHWLWRCALLFTLSIIFYNFSIDRAGAWGAQVKGAFDLYRLELLKSLGYQRQFLTYFDEKGLWQRISNQLLYADSREDPLWYQAPPTRLVASPVGVHLQLKRELRVAVVTGNLEVKLTLENRTGTVASKIMLSESLPDGFKPILGSIRSSVGNVFVSNLAPLEMSIEDIAPGAKVSVSYGARASVV